MTQPVGAIPVRTVLHILAAVVGIPVVLFAADDHVLLCLITGEKPNFTNIACLTVLVAFLGCGVCSASIWKSEEGGVGEGGGGRGWGWQAERGRGKGCSTSGNGMSSSTRLTSLRISASATPRMRNGKAMFSNTVRCGNKA